MNTLLLIPLLPFAVAALLAGIGARSRGLLLALAMLAPLGVLAVALSRFEAVLDGEVWRASLSWLPSAGLNLSLRLDALALLFVLLIAGIGVMVLLYARHYLHERDSLCRLYVPLLVFMGAMLGIVTSDNLLLLVVFWELTSLSSFLLIAYWQGNAASRRGARLALALTGGGGIALLVGVLLIGEAAGGYTLDVVLSQGDAIRGHALYPLALCMVLLGVFTKSAQVPLHFWLPHAMAAPTPVSAYLHSATMVKVGVFLLARLHPALAGTELWTLLVSGAGLLTLITGAYIAFFQHDLKSLLAYSTVSHLGLMVFLLGLGTVGAAFAALVHLVAHALFKAPLFMTAGIVDHATGSRDLRRLGGLWRVMPVTAVGAGVAAAAMAGLPFMSGYLSKRLFLGESLAVAPAGVVGWFVVLVIGLSGVLAVAYSLRFALGLFAGRPGVPVTHHVAPAMVLPVAVFAVLSLLVGLWPEAMLGTLLVSAKGALLQMAPVNPTLQVANAGADFVLSLATIAGGVLLYLLRRQAITRIERLRWVDGLRLAEASLRTCVAASAGLVRVLDTASLQRQAALLVGSAVVVGAVALHALPVLRAGVPFSRLDPATTIGLLVLVATGLATAVLHRKRLLALLLMGGSGLLVTLIFARFSAPDLALTQLSVEVMAVVILMLALSFLPQESPVESSLRRRLRDVTLAGVAGLGVTVLCLAVLTRDYASISGFFLENSVPLGGGANVVNVILVDFRGFDTLGEITVLGIAALAIFIMTRTLELSERVAPSKGHLDSANAHPLFLRMVSRPVLPMALLVAAYIFLRGHNAPGGGFIAGLIAAVALTLQYMANGLDWTHGRRRTTFRPVVALGLVIAGLTGCGSLLFGYPFLTSWHAHVHVPLLGDIEFATAILFDAGVFLTVVGSTLLVLSNMGKLMTIHGPGEERG